MVVAACAAAAFALAGCGLFSNPPPPTAFASPGASGSPLPDPSLTPGGSGSASPSETLGSSPIPRSVRSIVVVADGSPIEPGTRNALSWQGARDAAAALGATASLETPLGPGAIASGVAAALATDPTIVVTVGADAADATRAAALAHPLVEFLAVDQVEQSGGPPNLEGLVFDEAEAGYLAGIVAAAVSTTRTVGIAEVWPTDPASASYEAGFRSGVRFGRPGTLVAIEYSGSAGAPDGGRAAARRLTQARADVLFAQPGLSGVGALREACARKVLAIAAGIDAWLVLPEVRPCLVASVTNLYDVAVRDAITGFAAGLPTHENVVGDVASGQIAVSALHVKAPEGLDALLAQALAAMRSGPPRPTPPPPSPATPPPPPSASPASTPTATSLAASPETRGTPSGTARPT